MPVMSRAQNREVTAGSIMMPTASSVPSAWKPPTKFITTSARNAICAAPPARLTERRNPGSTHSSTSGRQISARIISDMLVMPTISSNVDLLHFLFGSVLAVDDPALILIVGITSVSLVILALIWRPLVLECVDPGFLRSVSRAGGPAHLAFMALVVMNLVGGFQALGTLLAVGIMMLPAVTSRFWARDITGMIGVAVGGAAVSGYAGLLVSYHANLPSGPAIILVAGALYAISVVFGPVGGLIWHLLPRRHLEA